MEDVEDVGELIQLVLTPSHALKAVVIPSLSHSDKVSNTCLIGLLLQFCKALSQGRNPCSPLVSQGYFLATRLDGDMSCAFLLTPGFPDTLGCVASSHWS